MSAHYSERCSRIHTVADSNLPLDLWRSVLCYLLAEDLCRCASVCRSWRYLVASLDVSSWRRFYLASNGGKHPLWPRQTEGNMHKSWYVLYREHVMASKFWSKVNQDHGQFNCLMLPIRKKAARRIIKVGPGRQHRSLRSALDVASKYDTISLAPGVYNEQFEVSAKIPFELVGEGSPGAVVLIMSIDQNAPTGRLSNLVLRAPWFTGCVLKVGQGHLQVDHCWLEQGQVKVSGAAASAHFSFCSFQQVSLCFTHTTYSLLENCELDQSSISVEGYPKDHVYSSQIRSLYTDWGCHDTVSKQRLGDDNDYTSSIYTPTTTSSAFQLNKSEVDSIGVASIGSSSSRSDLGDGRDSVVSGNSTILSDSSSFRSETSDEEEEGNHIVLNNHGETVGTQRCVNNNPMLDETGENSDKMSPALGDDLCGEVFESSLNLKEHSSKGGSKTEFSQPVNSGADNVKFKHIHKESTAAEFGRPDLTSQFNRVHNNENAAESSFTGKRMVGGNPGGAAGHPHPWPRSASRMTALPSLSISSKSKLTAENLPPMEDLIAGSSEESGSDRSSVVSGHSQHSGHKGRISPPWSSDSESVLEAKLEMSFRDVLRKNPDLVQAIADTKGPLIKNCCIHSGRGGVKVSQQAQCRLEKSELRGLQYGIRCLQNAKVAIVENEIHHMETSAIFVRLAAHGLILGNNIYCTNEAGIDVRRNAYPLIQCNRIHHSKRSGVAVLGSGSGTIKGNNIYQNREAGVCVLYKGDPHVVGNRICHGGAAGITVSEQGRGYLIDNYIANNRWGGIEIKNQASPKVYRNVICGGLADGIVVGHRGHGVIQANTIKGNEGCGVWMMGGHPLLQLNQIYNNNSAGISLVQDKEGVFASERQDGSDSLSEVSEDLVSVYSEGDRGDAGRQSQHTQLLYNTVFHNNGYGVLCHHSEALTLHGNAVHDNKDVGVCVKQEQSVQLSSNSITSNAGVGILVSKDAKVSIESNGIYENKEHGVIVEGEASISNNDIFCNGESALVLTDTSVTKIKSNRIHCPREIAVNVSPLAEGSFHNNQLYPGKQAILSVGHQSRLRVEHNTTIENQSLGVLHHVQEWHLQDPPPRPNIEAPPNVLPDVPPDPISMVTRVVLPSETSASYLSPSKLCRLL